jgi:hypothetical protein
VSERQRGDYLSVGDIVAGLRHGRGPTEGATRDAWVHAIMQDAADEITRLTARVAELEAALRGLVHNHDQLVSSGDCGFWDVEKEPEMIAARAALEAGGGDKPAPIARGLVFIEDDGTVRAPTWRDT